MASLDPQKHGEVQMVTSVLTTLRTGELGNHPGHERSLKLKKALLFSGSYKLATRFLVHLWKMT